MQNMTLIQLECLTALNREQDYQRAAAACGVSVDALFGVLRSAETAFDTRLLKPGESFAGFTEDGERVLGWAARSLGECDQLRRDVRAIRADEAMAALIERRSVSPKRLSGPGPGQEDIARMLQAALRAPDHGGLHPWRVMEFPADRRNDLAALFEQEKRRRDPMAPAEDLRRAREHATRAPVLLAFVISPKPRRKVPVREQWLSAGAALGNLLNAAHGLGYGAIMLSGERCFDAKLAQQLGLTADEFLAGFISLGHVAQVPPRAAVVPAADVCSTWAPLPAPLAPPTFVGF